MGLGLSVRDIITMLRSSERAGAEKDIPEGSRTLILSDTLANHIADDLEELKDGSKV